MNIAEFEPYCRLSFNAELMSMSGEVVFLPVGYEVMIVGRVGGTVTVVDKHGDKFMCSEKCLIKLKYKG